MESDDQLAVLARVEDSARHIREQTPLDAPPDLRAGLLDALSTRLPAPRPTPAPASAPNRSLAGFSERLSVFTQAEEDVPPLVSNAPIWLAAVAASGLVVMVVLWLVGNLLQAGSVRSFRWIEVRSGNTILIKAERAGAVNEAGTNRRCAGSASGTPTTTAVFLPRGRSTEQVPVVTPTYQSLPQPVVPGARPFFRMSDKDQLRLSLGFEVEFLPAMLTTPSTYTLRLTEMAVSPCGDGPPDPHDPAAVVKLGYSSRMQSADGYDHLSPLVVFQAQQLPVSVDVSNGTWKIIREGGAQGVYWRGGPYRDIEGTDWPGDVSVLVVERGDMVTTFIGYARQGITEEMLVGVLRWQDQTVRARQTEAVRPSLSFSWIELQRGNTIIVRRRSPELSSVECATLSMGSPAPSFVRVDSISDARSYIGYPPVEFPALITGTISLSPPSGVAPAAPGSVVSPSAVISQEVTYNLITADVAVRPCMAHFLNPGDPGATLKFRYVLNSDRTPDGSFVAFQTYRQPVTLDLRDGAWEEVVVGDSRGVFWSGNGYRDFEGIEWPDGSNVLLMEKGDMVLALVSSRMSKDLMLEVLRHVRW
jgi:hypothetical protein